MKNVILDKALFSEVLRINSECDSFCTILNCSLIKLHENAHLYACVRSSNEGTPCKLYIADSHNTIDKNRDDATESQWIEAIGDQKDVNVYLCCKTISGDIEKSHISFGVKTPLISQSLCSTMDRLSNDSNSVYIICHNKKYGEAEQESFQKRSIINLSSIDSTGVDIIYFNGADKLIEKLLYAGCRELTVFITEPEYKNITKTLNKISRKAPFSNRITVVIGSTYKPKTTSALLIGNIEDIPANVSASVFFSSSHIEGEGIVVSVGQNTTEVISSQSSHRLRPHTLHYITSIMSELVLNAISTKQYRAKRLFKVNSKTLVTETIIKED